MISTNKKKMKQKMGYLSVAAAAGLFFASSFPLRFFWCGLQHLPSAAAGIMAIPNWSMTL